jgi:methionyl-tRNA synthetase
VPFYLTTAIDYANGDPHIGHALEKIGADAIARYRRLCGDSVHFLMGMDEHGQKVAQAAAERGLSPQELVDRVAASFEQMWELLGISHDQFIRTSQAEHRRGVHALIERMLQRRPEDFYEKSYEGWYCVGCELFKRDNEIVEGRCVLHPTRALEWTEERNWFFRLTAYESFLRDLFARRPGFLEPSARRNEILGLLESGLEDISITRSRLAWAIPFPRPTTDGETQGTWVWFDALPNYLTATGFPDEGYEKRWPAQLHVIGKDITRLHCVIWPAMLECAGLALPERVWAHGFVSLGGERLSKSAGVKLDLKDAAQRFGPDAFRYFLLREVPFDGDGSFSWERFGERYNSDLANAFGNLASRTLAMVDRYFGGTVPPATASDDPAGVELREQVKTGCAEYSAAMESFRLHEGLQALWRMVAAGNAYVDRKAPWKLAKNVDSSDELSRTLSTLVGLLAELTVRLTPFMPTKSVELWTQLGAPGSPDAQKLTPAPLAFDPAGWRVTRGVPLFPRAEPTESVTPS